MTPLCSQLDFMAPLLSVLVPAMLKGKEKMGMARDRVDLIVSMKIEPCYMNLESINIHGPGQTGFFRISL